MSALSIAIRGSEGESVLGNVFIVVEHKDSGRKWRGLRYQLRTKSYIYSSLPAGRFRLRVVAAGYGPLEKRIVLKEGEDRAVALSLQPQSPSAPVMIDAGSELAEYSQFARELYQERELRQRFGANANELFQQRFQNFQDFSSAQAPKLTSQTEFLAALMCDHNVLNALSQPIYALAPDVFVKWVESQLCAAWKFSEPADNSRMVNTIVEQRVRLYVLVKALLRNPVIQSRITPCSEKKLTTHLLHFLVSLETPRIDNVMPILVQCLQPELAPVERLARSLLQTFEARVPIGAASRNSNPLKSDLASLTELFLREENRHALESEIETEDTEEQIAALMFLLADIAHCVAGALDRSSIFIEGLRLGRDYT